MQISVPSPMRNGEHNPFITLGSVRAALDSVIHVSTAYAPNPLEHLLLVDEFLTNPDLPKTKLDRQFALNYLLISIIREEYCRLRNVFGMGQTSEDMSLAHTLEQVQEDLHAGSTELVVWNLLYVRYVRSDLGLTLEMLAQPTHTDARTLRRYMRHALEIFTKNLIQREWEARHRQRERRLLSELPSAKSTLLIGREDAVREIERFLAVPGRQHIVVIGEAGIGKSIFVQEVLRKQIVGGALDHLIWIHHPPSVTFVRHHLIERLLPEGTRISLGEYLLLYPVGIVLDSIESMEQQGLETLLDELSGALVFITTRVSAPLHNITRQIMLDELDESDSVSLAHNIVGSSNSSRAAYRRVGGNPLAIKLAAQTIDDIRERHRQTLYMFALFPPGPVNGHDLCELWPDLTGQTDIVALAQRGLIESVSEDQLLYLVPTSSRKQVEQNYAQNKHEREMINDLLYKMRPDSPTATLKVVEQALLSPWLTLDLPWQHQWIEQLWSEGVNQGHCARWCTILESCLNKTEGDDLTLLTAYGICLRRLAQWDSAEAVFQRILHLTGQIGAFLPQARAMVELGVLYKNQGHYEKAPLIFAQVASILQNHPDLALTNLLRRQQAQIAIESEDAAEAFRVLSEIQDLSPAVLALRSEAFLLMGDWRTCLELAQATLELPGISPAFEAQSYSIMGRSYEMGGEFTLASRYLESAVTLLEQADDRFTLARAQSNLGAVLIREKAYNDAQCLLEQAASAQTQFKDQLGLAMTRHNLRVLHIAQVESRP